MNRTTLSSARVSVHRVWRCDGYFGPEYFDGWIIRVWSRYYRVRKINGWWRMYRPR